MNVTSLECPNCHSTLNVSEDATFATCEYCGSTVAIDDGTVKVDVSLSNQEEAGYLFEKGRQRAQAEFQPATVVVQLGPAPKKRKTWLWVLGWIFIFPVPLTILMLKSDRTKDLDIRVRVGIAVAGWLVYVLIAAFGGSGTSSNTARNASSSNTANTSAQVQSNMHAMAAL